MARIALAQMCTGIDPDANAAKLESAIEEAARGGATMLFTPEMSGLLDRDRERAAAHLHTEEDDPVLRRAQEAASAAGIWVSLGSLAVRRPGTDKLSNRAFVIDAGGVVRATYDKLHLFDVDLPTGESWRESNAYQAGTGAAVVNTPIGQLGLSICYDLRFPMLYGALSGAGAEVLAIPAAFTVPTGRAHWHVLQRARAIENACFVVSAAQTGKHEDGRETYGHSLVIDPWGEVLLDMDTAEAVGFADIDVADVSAIRARIPVLQHRRAAPGVVQA